jgi:hypothetical protein
LRADTFETFPNQYWLTSGNAQLICPHQQNVILAPRGSQRLRKWSE